MSDWKTKKSCSITGRGRAELQLYVRYTCFHDVRALVPQRYNLNLTVESAVKVLC